MQQQQSMWQRFCATWLVALLLSPLVQAAEQPAISIIMDDMGYRLYAGKRAIRLPGAITYSFLPHAPHVRQLAQLVHASEREIMLHLPMQSESGKALGPGGLTNNMTEQDFIAVLQGSIEAIPHVSGFNNHMGSLLTKNKQWMQRLMHKVAAGQPLFFVDSKTTRDSVAMQQAQREGLPTIQRDIFIDHETDPAFIQRQLKKLIARARRKGTALAIAHPKKQTLQILEQWLPRLQEMGIRLVPVSELIQLQQQRRLAYGKLNTTTPGTGATGTGL